MQKFLVVYKVPVGSLEEWMEVPEAERKAEEGKMMEEWNNWIAAHAEVKNGTTYGVGKAKLVTKGNVEDIKNDLMLISLIEAESHEAAADLFKDNPHFGIPTGTIEVMPINDING